MVCVDGRKKKTLMMLIVFGIRTSLLATPPAPSGHIAPLRSSVRQEPEPVHAHNGAGSPLSWSGISSGTACCNALVLSLCGTRNLQRTRVLPLLLQLELCFQRSVWVEAADMQLSRHGAAILKQNAHPHDPGILDPISFFRKSRTVYCQTSQRGL